MGVYVALKLDCTSLPILELTIYCPVSKCEKETMVAYSVIRHALLNNSSLDRDALSIKVSVGQCEISYDYDSGPMNIGC